MFDEDPNVFAEVFRTGTELLHHPQTVHNGHVIEIDDPAFGTVLQPGPLVEMHTTPASVDRAAPALDADGPALRARPSSPQPADSRSTTRAPRRRSPASPSSSSARTTRLRSARRSSPSWARA